MLTADQKANRVAWATNHLNDQWETTLFSDETAFQRLEIQYQFGIKVLDQYGHFLKIAKKFLPGWVLCAKGKTSLHCFTGIMDARFYTEILEGHLPEIRRMLGRRWRFQQDNDPKHTSQVAKEFLKENFSEVMDWPSNSPDLNPIEQ